MAALLTTADLRGAPGLARDLASAGWVVELVLVFADNSVEHRYFAVGLERAVDAQEAVLRYPGVTKNDTRNARRPLTPIELAHLGLKQDTIRPYGFSINSTPRE
jgi:hypothetical protein